jgi:hypothetical protein
MSRYKGRVKDSEKDSEIDRYFPVRISVPIGMGPPAREWSVTYSATARPRRRWLQSRWVV